MLSDDYGESIAMEIEKTLISDELEKENLKEEDTKMAESKPEASKAGGVNDLAAADTASNPATDASTDPAADDNGDDTSDDDDDDDLSATISDTDSDKDTSPKVDPEILLIKATALKEEGNNFFKENDFDKAGRSCKSICGNLLFICFSLLVCVTFEIHLSPLFPRFQIDEECRH
jgi:hypothetical protein